MTSMVPSDHDGPLPPPVGTPNTFALFNAVELGHPADALRLFDFHADFANPASSTFSERAGSPLGVAAFDPISPSGRNDIRLGHPLRRPDAWRRRALQKEQSHPLYGARNTAERRARFAVGWDGVEWP